VIPPDPLQRQRKGEGRERRKEGRERKKVTRGEWRSPN